MSDRGLTLFLWSDKNTLRELHPNLVDLKTEIYIFVPVQGKPAFFFFFTLPRSAHCVGRFALRMIERAPSLGLTVVRISWAAG